MDLLIIIPAFLVTIGILVTIHEFGHYWVARRLGVKVLRFSVGFGKPLWAKRQGDDQIEYVLATWPLGGYVQMLDEREGTVKPEEAHRAFNRQVVWKRFAIVAAGPLANFILAGVLYTVMYGVGVPAMPPLVTSFPNTPAAQAGFTAGDRIVAVGGSAVESYQDARALLLEHYLIDPLVRIEVVTAQGQSVGRHLDLTDMSLLEDEGDYFQKIGLRAWIPNMQIRIARVLPDSPAAQAGLLADDKIVTLNQRKPETVDSFISAVQNSGGQPLQVQVARESRVVDLTVTPRQEERDGKSVYTLGVALGEYVPPDVLKSLQFTQHYGLWDAMSRGIDETRQITVMSLKLMGRLVTGEISLSNISGPITIARFSGEAAKSGFTQFIGFLAIISVSIGILNLLPIPMLDGGHLLYYMIEIIKGSPVSQQVEELGMRVGLTAIGSLMVLALYNDLMRLIR